jgi:hypothetical protein
VHAAGRQGRMSRHGQPGRRLSVDGPGPVACYPVKCPSYPRACPAPRTFKIAKRGWANSL